MLLVILALGFQSSRRVNGQDLDLPYHHSTIIDRRTQSSCNDLNNCRALLDIIWSCVVTVFSCTWVAVHPNVPAPYESDIVIRLRRCGIMIMALIAPELLILWAMRQWLVSRKLAKKYHAKGWTQTHGFFALMGGFMLYDGDKALYTLLPPELETLSQDGKIVFPKITEKEIKDRSKGDALSKGFVLIQTGWFALQCIARGPDHLPITELEVVTLAFAVLSLATYALWWNKPLDVQCPVPVHLSSPNPESESKHADGDGDAHEDDEKLGIFKRGKMRIIKFYRKSEFSDIIAVPIMQFLNLGFFGGDVEPDKKRVPTFYSGDVDDSDDDFTSMWLWFAGLVVSSIFGGVHCIAWSFQFPSHEKELLWRVCALAITCLPLFSVLFLGTLYGILPDNVSDVLPPIFVVIFSIFYIVARMILIVEAFLLLKTLPHGAFQTVQWTDFIPHV
ncbi:hypothetical protein BD410DRAFT_754858 [Rickenella mellea]|uniref:Uncharacterized protein n=1 Tax=Rickenella mellea TaxID=50990 RepID=A0A4Y7PR30_9AGAM|nr:hypothetical protein BD410DRAFT_754858 [Rickenella mellea]